jgi:P4 family phage/plasmid primase-like protien
MTNPLVCSIAPVEAILRVAAQLPVFPCRRSAEEIVIDGRPALRKAKSPLVANGFDKATQNPDQIRAWWNRWPDALVGIPTGSLTQLAVVDYDIHKADRVANEWIASHSSDWMVTRTHGTLNGGRHYLFRTPKGHEYRNGVCLTLEGIKREGIDLRAQRGYIIWWPLHGGSTVGEIAPLPAGLIDEQRIETRDLPPLPKATPRKWAFDKATLIDILPYLDPTNRDPWRDAGMAIHLASDGSDEGFELWHAWSAGEITGECPPGYSGINDCRYFWSTYNRGPRERGNTITIGSLVRAAKEKGYVRARQRESAKPDAETPPAEPPEAPVEACVDDDPGVEAGLSDHELALRFSERHKDHLRYVALWDKWLIWDGKRWAPDDKKQVFDLSRKLCNDVLAEHFEAGAMTPNQRATLRKRLGSAQTVYAVTKLAGNDQRYHAVTVAQLDSNPWELNTPGGVVDLQTGLVSPHDPAKLHTKITAAALTGDCPQFMKILTRAQPNEEIRKYVQRVFGYGMTGSSRDHALSFWYGSGRNGKGTIAHAFRHAMGDYGLEVGSELFMESHNDRHPTEIAVLRGARFIAASEIDTGRKWNEARLKRLTGGDPISARYIGKDLFEFEPTHTLVIVGNQKPGLRSVDEAMRARMHLVDFAVTVPVEERDLALPEKLKAEYGGILAWALIGCREWQKTGLKPPAEVLAATSEYLDGEDSIANWISECCLTEGVISLSAAHKSYRDWCEKNAAPTLGRNTFGDQLETHGYKRPRDDKGKRSVKFLGLSLPIKGTGHHSEQDDSDDDPYSQEDQWSRNN